ncbi:hypothetical protein SAMN02910353_01917 [Ruminococcus sp. YRD2003]|uniref:hypothetical protein n=1 Tax=Ruminococcus sp. YRD2003 TaxID=1452313 RepID=UPI0008AEB6C0|nr:hypothetical protein SAMN02910353_01917 [Ruminococcus flavefaciens]
MQEKLEKGLLLSLVGNALFVAFGIICYIYYLTFHVDSIFSRVLETTAYCTEFLGFGLLLYSDYLLSVSLRLRRLLKVSYTAYIILEALIMVLELNSGRIEFYQPYSMWLAIVHAVVSGAVCFSFLQLDPDNTKYEVSVVICIGMIFFGMMGAIFGIRVYFSVLVNAVSFTLLFGAIRFFRSREEIEIDCYGDKARVAEYKSTMFSDPLIVDSGKTKKAELPAEVIESEPEAAKSDEKE